MKTRYIYCDSCVFLAYFNAETGRVKTLEQLFEEIQRDSERKLITSVLSIVEVSNLAEERGKTRSRLRTDFDEKLNTFWADISLLEFVEFHEPMARKARDLIRQAIGQGYTLKTIDAIHLVSASYAGAIEFFTYDNELFKYGQMIGYSIREPYVAAPQLPLQYHDDESR